MGEISHLNEFWRGQLDYILFCNGLAWLVLAAVCLVLRKSDKHRLPWGLLALFGILHGANKWLDLFTTYSDLTLTQQIISILLSASAIIILAEFGRIGIACFRSYWTYRILLLVLLLIAGLGAFKGLNDLNTTILYATGVAGLWAALALKTLASRVSPSERRWLLAASVLFILYSLSRFIAPDITFFPTDFLNEENFLHFAHIPIQLLRAVLTFGLATTIWGYSQTEREQRDSEYTTRRSLFTYVMIIVPLSIVILGWALVDHLGRREDSRMRSTMLICVRAVAATLDSAQIAQLTGTPADLHSDAYQGICRQLAMIQSTLQTNCRFLYLMGLRDGKVIFLADAEPQSSDQFSPPGEIYDNPSRKLRAIFIARHPFVEGPFTDDYGWLVSAHAPILDPDTKRVIAVLGIDIKAPEWIGLIQRIRLEGIAAILTVCMLTLLSLTMMQIMRDSRARIATSESRFRRVFEQAPEGIFILEPHTHAILLANRAIAEWLGHTQHELLQIRYDAIVEPGEPDIDRNLMITLQGDSPVTIERRYLTANGMLPVEVTGSRMRFHGQECVILFIPRHHRAQSHRTHHSRAARPGPDPGIDHRF